MVPAEDAEANMLVREAREVAQRWVEEHAVRLPGFRGAYFTGSLNWMNDAGVLEPASDVDVMLIFADTSTVVRFGKFRFHEVLLEMSSSSLDQLGTVDQILGNYHVAPSFRTTQVIADPSGRLGELRASVTREYAKAAWVRRRCAQARSRVTNRISTLRPGAAFHDQVTTFLFGAGVMTHVLLVAGLRNPTVRKRYVAVHDLLAHHQRLDVHEHLLALAGYADVPRARVEHHLRALTEVFNLTAPLEKSPYRFATDINEVSRPIAIDGTWAMLQDGYHREALFWMFATWGRCQTILALDGSAEAIATSDAGYRAMAAGIGITSYAGIRRRADAVVAWLPSLDTVAEAIIAGTPEIEQD